MLAGEHKRIIRKRKLILLATQSPDDIAVRPVDLSYFIKMPHGQKDVPVLIQLNCIGMCPVHLVRIEKPDRVNISELVMIVSLPFPDKHLIRIKFLDNYADDLRIYRSRHIMCEPEPV